jgi:hypothetical protein
MLIQREVYKTMLVAHKEKVAKAAKAAEEERKKELAERGDAMMEESFMQARKELVEMEKVGRHPPTRQVTPRSSALHVARCSMHAAPHAAHCTPHTAHRSLHPIAPCTLHAARCTL